jgi:hypothetical protein
VALIWPEPLGEIVRRGEGVMSSRLGAVPAVSCLVWPLCFRGSRRSREHAASPFCPVRRIGFIRAHRRPHPFRSDSPAPVFFSYFFFFFFARSPSSGLSQFLARLPLASISFASPMPPISVVFFFFFNLF